MSDKQIVADGIVYVLSNRGFWSPERPSDDELLPIIKIGHTTPATPEALQKRMNGLYKTGVPLPFDLEYAKAVANPDAVEKTLHTIFKQSRVNPNREFFYVEIDSVVAALKPYTGEEITLGSDETSDEVSQADIAARNKTKKVTSYKTISFVFMGISIGEELVSTIDPNKIAKVVSDTEVEYNGEIMSPAKAATQVSYEKTRRWVSRGSFFNWKYRGERLEDLHNRKSSEQKQ